MLLCGQTSVAAKPNFVITIADDHGVYHSSVYGASEFQTPCLQQMAKQGMRFDNAYVASPACAPSRAALFTGRMPCSNGIVGNHEIELKPDVRSLLPTLLEQGYEVVFHGKVGHAGQKHFGPISLCFISAIMGTRAFRVREWWMTSVRPSSMHGFKHVDSLS